jgi:hypothetical protein
MALALGACASLNPFSAAKTTEQKSYALYGTFVIFEQQGAKLIQSPEIPNSVKRAIQQADAVAKPSIDQLKVAADSLLSIKLQLQAGTSDKEKLTIAATNLKKWYDDAVPKVRCLVIVVQEKGPC